MGSRAGIPNKPKMISWNGTDRDPATYIAKVMLDKMAEPELRLKAAIALLPYVHSRQPIETIVTNTDPINTVTLQIVNGT